MDSSQFNRDDALGSPQAKPAPPLALLAELTHACPLACLYCSNPVQLSRPDTEMTTAQWLSVIEQAADLGVVQIHFSGGEPLLRQDLAQLVRRGRELDLYVNLITSGIGLTAARAHELQEAGVDCVQLSMQDAEANEGDLIAGAKVHERKLESAGNIRSAGLTLHMNYVLHRHNIMHLKELVDLGIECGAERIELANTQYYGWGLINRRFLLPSREQLEQATIVFDELRQQLKSRQAPTFELIWVLSDYYEDYPKPCMGGWASHNLTVAPDGVVLPCTAARSLPIPFENVSSTALASIWNDSQSFNAFRGFDWMMEPCRSCERRFADFGGCRCQAFALTGDAARTDPVCKLSSDRHIVDAALAEANEGENVYTEGASNEYTYRHF